MPRPPMKGKVRTTHARGIRLSNEQRQQEDNTHGYSKFSDDSVDHRYGDCRPWYRQHAFAQRRVGFGNTGRHATVSRDRLQWSLGRGVWTV
jgi:hypothetical protein